MASDSETVHLQVLRAVLRAAAELDMHSPPPAMGQRIHRLIRRFVNDPDPYAGAKRQNNRLALDLVEDLADRVSGAADPLDAAVRAAIAGNIIDLGAKSELADGDLEATLERAMTEPLVGDASNLAAAAEEAKSILYLADNAGEIVFDRLLIERLPTDKLTLVVKGAPVINDATYEDAEAAGLTEFVEVIDNGSDAPGTLLGSCSEAFQARFRDADLVVAKGQGNFETLSGTDKHVFYILMAKCPVVADHLGCPVGSLVARETNRPTA